MSDQVQCLSDSNPSYPKILKEILPDSTHSQVEGGRGCVVGQGELKNKKFDPMFALNHTAAMIRANMNRLFMTPSCALAALMRYARNQASMRFLNRRRNQIAWPSRAVWLMNMVWVWRRVARLGGILTAICACALPYRSRACAKPWTVWSVPCHDAWIFWCWGGRNQQGR